MYLFDSNTTLKYEIVIQKKLYATRQNYVIFTNCASLVLCVFLGALFDDCFFKNKERFGGEISIKQIGLITD